MVCAALFFFAGEVSVSCLNWIYGISGFSGLERDFGLNTRRVWASTPQIADCRA